MLINNYIFKDIEGIRVMLSKDILIDIYNQRRVEVYDWQMPESEFSTQNLVGLCIVGARVLDSKRENPRYLSVFDLKGGSSLVFGVEESEDGFDFRSDTHCFWIDK